MFAHRQTSLARPEARSSFASFRQCSLPSDGGFRLQGGRHKRTRKLSSPNSSVPRYSAGALNLFEPPLIGLNTLRVGGVEYRLTTDRTKLL